MVEHGKVSPHFDANKQLKTLWTGGASLSSFCIQKILSTANAQIKGLKKCILTASFFKTINNTKCKVGQHTANQRCNNLLLTSAFSGTAFNPLQTRVYTKATGKTIFLVTE